ncbi:hypothetical protein TrST_g13015, partial [Triparma strigata]
MPSPGTSVAPLVDGDAVKNRQKELISQLHVELSERADEIATLKAKLSKQARELQSLEQSNHNAPLEPDNPDVANVGEHEMLVRDMTIKTISLTIHEDPSSLLKCMMMGDTGLERQARGRLGLRLQLVKVVVPGVETVVFWSFTVDSTRFSAVLALEVSRKKADEIVMKVSPAKEGVVVGETTQLQLRGSIILQPRPLGQTYLTFTAHISSSSSAHLGTDDLLCKLGNLFYERFEKEEVIDERAKEYFSSNIQNAPPLTDAERAQITLALGTVGELSKAKRVAGIINESVEKFYHRVGARGGAGWGMTVAKMDVSAMSFFTELWLLNTFEKKAKNKHVKVRDFRENLADGTRGALYSVSVRLPGAFSDRLFRAWLTWDQLIQGDGRKTFVIAMSPIEDYEGTIPVLPESAKNLKMATSKGVFIVKEITDNTCEFTRAQMVDLKVKQLPANMMDILAKQELEWANEVQEKFRRNGKE